MIPGGDTLSARGAGAGERLRAALGGFAVVAVIIGSSVAAFFNPLWITFAQDRAGVTTMTGLAPDQVRGVTISLLSDLLLGPPDFAVAVDGVSVLGADERLHMVDVRNVLIPAVSILAATAVLLAIVVAANRRSASLWRAISHASRALAVIGLAVGVVALLFFDVAFRVFHLVFFPQGNFSFDPRTQRLTQLFPDQFWIETTIGIALTAIALAAVVNMVARGRLAGLAAAGDHPPRLRSR